MEVRDARSALLTNYEVHQLVKRTKDSTTGAGFHKLKQLSTILYETDAYLQETPCSTQSIDQLRALSEALRPFRLTKAETLQIFNVRPCSPVEVQLVIEECEERLSEEQVEQLIAIIAEHLPIAKETADQDENEQDDDNEDADNEDAVTKNEERMETTGRPDSPAVERELAKFKRILPKKNGL